MINQKIPNRWVWPNFRFRMLIVSHPASFLLLTCVIVL